MNITDECDDNRHLLCKKISVFIDFVYDARSEDYRQAPLVDKCGCPCHLSQVAMKCPKCNSEHLEFMKDKKNKDVTRYVCAECEATGILKNEDIFDINIPNGSKRKGVSVPKRRIPHK